MYHVLPSDFPRIQHQGGRPSPSTVSYTPDTVRKHAPGVSRRREGRKQEMQSVSRARWDRLTLLQAGEGRDGLLAHPGETRSV